MTESSPPTKSFINIPDNFARILLGPKFRKKSFDLLVISSKMNDSLLSKRIYLLHQANLSITLWSIRLVNTDCINLQSKWLSLVSEVVKGSQWVRCDRHGTVLNKQSSGIRRISPDIGESGVRKIYVIAFKKSRVLNITEDIGAWLSRLEGKKANRVMLSEGLVFVRRKCHCVHREVIILSESIYCSRT